MGEPSKRQIFLGHPIELKLTINEIDPYSFKGKSQGFVWYLVCCGFTTPAIAMARTQAREKYGIEGEEMNDWCLSCFCPGCSEFQVAAEIQKRKEAGEH